MAENVGTSKPTILRVGAALVVPTWEVAAVIPAYLQGSTMTPLRSIPLDLAQAAAITAVAPEVIHYLMARGAGPANLSVNAVAAWIASGKAAKWQYPKPIVKKEDRIAV